MSRSPFVRANHHRHGFTVTELLVVIAVMGMLAALILPAVQSARESARQTGCRNNLRQIGAALAAFESAHKRLPAGRDADQNHHHSWATAILGHLDLMPLFEKYDYDQAWDHPANRDAVMTSPTVFRCPSALEDWPGKTDYGGNYGSTLTGLDAGFGKGRGWEAGTLLAVRMPHGPQFRRHPVRIGDVADGTSHTFLVLEDADRPAETNGLWASGHNCIAIDKPVNEDSSDELFSRHPGGAHALMVDGSVRLLSESIDLTVLGSLATRAAGEITNN